MRKTPVDYCLRLDDACPQMNTEKWARIERILDKYKVRPIVGVIPENRDPDFVAVADENFWKKACEWQKKRLDDRITWFTSRVAFSRAQRILPAFAFQ